MQNNNKNNSSSSKQYFEKDKVNIDPMMSGNVDEATINFILEYFDRNLDIPFESIKKIDFSGGMTNSNYKITLNDDRELLFRIPGAGTENLVNRHNEIINSKAIEFLGINERNIYFNIGDGVKISNFVSCAEPLSQQTVAIKKNMKKVTSILRKLHTSDVKMNNTFSYIDLIKDYEFIIKAQTHYEYIDRKYPDFTEKKEEILKLNEKIKRLDSFKLYPCHNDLVPENFIKSVEDEIFLIDWEYSGYNNPLWDLAAFILEGELSESNEKIFLHLYFQRPILKEEYLQLNFFKATQDILWSLWALVKELHGECFGEYGYKRYERGYNILKRGIIDENDSI